MKKKTMNVGRFYVAAEYWPKVADFLKPLFTVLETKDHELTVEVTAGSDLFRPVAVGETVPFYEIEFTAPHGSNTWTVTVCETNSRSSVQYERQIDLQLPMSAPLFGPPLNRSTICLPSQQNGHSSNN